jgi:hypothetical protein
MQKHSWRRRNSTILANTRPHDSIAISRRFALRIEPLGLMERLTTEFVRAGIDRQQQNAAITEREGATVPLASGTKDQEQSTRTRSRRSAEVHSRLILI